MGRLARPVVSLWNFISEAPWGALFVMLGGAAVCAAVLFFEWIVSPVIGNDAFGAAEVGAFIDQNETILWIVLVCIQTGLWFLLLGPSIQIAQKVKELGARSPDGTGLGVVVMALIAGGSVWVGSIAHGDYELPAREAKFAILTLIGFLTCLWAVLGLWRIYGALAELPDDAQADQGCAFLQALARFDRLGEGNPLAGLLRLHELMHRALALLGATLTAGVLATGALRSTLVAWSENDKNLHKEPDPFPLEFLLAYGVFFSMLLALIYAPVYIRFQLAGRALVQHYAKLLQPGHTEWSSALDRRKELQELLQLGVTPTASFQAGVAILAPLATSLLGVLLSPE